MTRVSEPMLEASVLHAPKQILELIVMEAIDRLLLDPLASEMENYNEFLRKEGLSDKALAHADGFYFNIATEAAELAGHVGYALAKVGEQFPTFEARLQAALSTANLQGYKPDEVLDFEDLAD